MEAVSPVLKRRPRLAVWRRRAIEYSFPVAATVVALISDLVDGLSAAVPWLVVVIVSLTTQWRLGHVWSWGWRAGHAAAQVDLLPLIDLEGNVDQLREVFLADPPSWRQEQDRLAQVDHAATTKAALELVMRLSPESRD